MYTYILKRLVIRFGSSNLVNVITAQHRCHTLRNTSHNIGSLGPQKPSAPQIIRLLGATRRKKT